MGAAYIEIQKIRNRSEPKPIDNIAKCASDDHAVSDCLETSCRAPQQYCKHATNGKGDKGQGPPWHSAEQTECNAVIAQECYIEPGKYRQAIQETISIHRDDGFRGLIGNQSRARRDQSCLL